ncbi:MAG TPA: glycoside hydrolase family 31 protein [Verrucomicrobiae bacterium]|nr:glycoside hydrolase family 31 protein [Verrucomicrobiae bacterium]
MKLRSFHLAFGMVVFGIALAVMPVCRAQAPHSQAGNEQRATGWQSLGKMSRPTWNGKALLFHGEQGVLSITPISDDVIRVRFEPGNQFGRDHSYAVVSREANVVDPKAEIRADSTTLTTASLKITVQHAPLRISFATAAGESLDSDDPVRGVSLADGSFRVAKRLRDDEHVYGFGEKNGRLDKRGWALGGYNFVMWNSDVYMYDASTDPLYVSVPFFMVTRHGQAHGIFLDNTWRTWFDVGHEREDLLTFGSDGGDLDYYFINGPDPKQIIERYTTLTGRMPMPPRWALGYNQCRYSYFPESRVRLLAETFREKKVPGDVIWLDIHYQDGYKPFTWDHERFPDPKKMLADLAAQGFHVVSIVDPHPEKEKGYLPYDTGLAGDHFVKRPDGTVFEGPVWPSQAEKSPGPSVFPDFSRPATREWWGSLYNGLLDDGIAGIWNDMDEPSVFVAPAVTMPLDLVFNNEGQPTSAREIHNVYGQLMSRATFEGLSKLRPNERPFVLTRASYAGGQRYAAVWPGDNTADWAWLRQSIPTLLGLGVSGFPFVGSDIGGFVRPGSAELYTRWLQTGVFYPFMRSHSELGAPDKEPWSFGYQYEPINRRAIELRYELLPYIYNVMEQANETGLPAMRPLFLEYPTDEETASLDDEFLFGSDILVAPVLWEGATERSVYLPKGDWYDYWTGKHFAGGVRTNLSVKLESIPLFVRGGAFIFRQPVVQYTGEMAGNPLHVWVVPAAESESSLYEDDGATLDYKKTGFMRRRFHQQRTSDSVVISVSAPEGNYRPAHRELELEIPFESEPRSVSLQTNGKQSTLPHLQKDAFEKSDNGWKYEDGSVILKDNDRFEAETVTIER